MKKVLTPKILLLLLFLFAAVFTTINLVLAEPETNTQATPSELTAITGDNWQNLPQQIIEDRAFRHYATVSRTDGTYRQMFIDEIAIQGILEGTLMPENAFIIMETYYNPEQESTNFTKERKGNAWDYGSFSPGRPSFETGGNLTCSMCHRGADSAVNGTFTSAMLRAALQEGQVMTTTCDRGGRSPCDASVYENFSTLE